MHHIYCYDPARFKSRNMWLGSVKWNGKVTNRLFQVKLQGLINLENALAQGKYNKESFTKCWTKTTSSYTAVYKRSQTKRRCPTLGTTLLNKPQRLPKHWLETRNPSQAIQLYHCSSLNKHRTRHQMRRTDHWFTAATNCGHTIYRQLSWMKTPNW